MEFAQFIALSNTTYFVVDSQVFFCRWRCGDYRRKSIFFVREIAGLQLFGGRVCGLYPCYCGQLFSEHSFRFSQRGALFKKRTELAFIYAVSLIGLGLNQLILLLLVEQAGVELMLSKSSAKGSVFLWNFSSRNFIVFHGEKQGAPKLHK